jgi:hypothetical protein
MSSKKSEKSKRVFNEKKFKEAAEKHRFNLTEYWLDMLLKLFKGEVTVSKFVKEYENEYCSFGANGHDDGDAQCDFMCSLFDGDFPYTPKMIADIIRYSTDDSHHIPYLLKHPSLKKKNVKLIVDAFIDAVENRDLPNWKYSQEDAEYAFAKAVKAALDKVTPKPKKIYMGTSLDMSAASAREIVRKILRAKSKLGDKFKCFQACTDESAVLLFASSKKNAEKIRSRFILKNDDYEFIDFREIKIGEV